MKILNNQTVGQENDVQSWGTQNLFKLISESYSVEEGLIESTKAMDVGNGCVIQVTNRYLNPDESYSTHESLVFVPGVMILENLNAGTKEVLARYIISKDIVQQTLDNQTNKNNNEEE